MVKTNRSPTRGGAVGAVLALTLSLPVAAAAGLHAELAPPSIHEGETVQLLLRQSGDASTAPDLSPLTQDFEILGTGRSQRVAIHNGVIATSTDWTVTLKPRRKGRIEVPALRAGNASSAPLELIVDDAPPPPQRADAPDLFLEAEVDQSTPFVQGEVRYRVRVFDGIGMLDGTLTEPTSNDLRISPVGEPRTYETEVAGRPYRVHERQYAVAPLRSGELTIPGVTLEARVPDPRPRDARSGRSLFEEVFGGDPFAGLPSGFASSFFDRAFARGEQVRIRSNPVSLSVRARPTDATSGWFLPARDVQLVESFSPESPRWVVGETVQRTIAIRALGAAPEQLPRIAHPSAEGARIYDEGSRSSTTSSETGTVSVLEQSFGLVPTTAGTLTLPAIEVEWFDTAAGEKRIASLPERSFEVLPGAGQSPTAGERKPAPVAAARGAANPSVGNHETSGSRELDPANSGALRALWLVPAALFVLAVGWFHMRRRRGAQSGSSAPEQPPQSATLARELQRACENNEAPAARAALIRWARAVWPEAPFLGASLIARRLGSARLASAVAELDRTLYGVTREPWRGRELWQAFQQAQSERKSAFAPPRLRALYPDFSARG